MSGYIELGAISSFSFLQSTMDPETLVQHGAELGFPALALTDYGGVYGLPRFHKAASLAGIRAITGACIDIEGIGRIRLLCESHAGYQNLCRLSTLGHQDRPKGHCMVTLEQLSEFN